MVRIATNGDSRVLAEMAVQMWDSHTVDELETEFIETLNEKQSAFFIKYINGLPVGFAQCGLRTVYNLFLKQMIRFASSNPIAIWNLKLSILSISQSLANSLHPISFAHISQEKRSSFA